MRVIAGGSAPLKSDRRDPPPGVSAEAAVLSILEVLDSIGDTCPECPPEPRTIAPSIGRAPHRGLPTADPAYAGPLVTRPALGGLKSGTFVLLTPAGAELFA